MRSTPQASTGSLRLAQYSPIASTAASSVSTRTPRKARVRSFIAAGSRR
jgi:hypothetical protein